LSFADRYHIERRLGGGAGGEVFLAYRCKDSLPVAIKFLTKHDSLPQQEARFVEEVKTLTRLQSPHVVRVLDAGRHQEQLYFVMELVDGSDLEKLVQRKGALSLRSTLVLVSQIAAGLQAIHREGIIHRDLKPGNVMVTQRGRAKLADFGLSKGQDSQVHTRSGLLLGTPGYMAPEIFEGKALTPKVDIYALGLLLFFLRSGRRAFQEENLADLMRAQMAGPADTSVALLDRQLQPLYLEMTTLSPEDRPDATEVQERCRPLLQKAPEASTKPTSESSDKENRSTASETSPPPKGPGKRPRAPPPKPPPRDSCPPQPGAWAHTVLVSQAPGAGPQKSRGRSPFLLLPFFLMTLIGFGFWFLERSNSPSLEEPPPTTAKSSPPPPTRKPTNFADFFQLGRDYQDRKIFARMLEEDWATQLSPDKKYPKRKIPQQLAAAKLIRVIDRNMPANWSDNKHPPPYLNCWTPGSRQRLRFRLEESGLLAAAQELLPTLTNTWWRKATPKLQREVANGLQELQRVNFLDSILGGDGKLIPGIKKALSPVFRSKILENRPGALWESLDHAKHLLKRCHMVTRKPHSLQNIALTAAVMSSGLNKYCNQPNDHNRSSVSVPLLPLEEGEEWLHVAVGLHDLFHYGMVRVGISKRGGRELVHVNFQARQAPFTHVIQLLGTDWDAFPLQLSFHRSLLGKGPLELTFHQEDLLRPLKKLLPKGDPLALDIWVVLAGISQLQDD
jgi:serine/threonine-protein kinase